MSAAWSQDRKYVITSANMDFIPPPVLGRVEVFVRSDGRYGLEDPFQHPQLYDAGWPHMSMIPRRPDDLSDIRQAIWWTPTTNDFSRFEECVVFGLGKLLPEPLKRIGSLITACSEHAVRYCRAHKLPRCRLHYLESSMRLTLGRLLDIPATFRDTVIQVASLQRFWLECTAWIDWMELCQDAVAVADVEWPHEVRSSAMGAFTNDPSTAQQLVAVGVPVWYLRLPEQLLGQRELVIRKVVPLQPVTSIVVHGDFTGGRVYVGLVGGAHLAALARMRHVYNDFEVIPMPDVERTPLPAYVDHSSRYSPYTSVSSGRIRAGRIALGADYAAVNDPLLPPSIPGFAAAAKTVRYEHIVAKGKCGYFLPRSDWFLGAQDQQRRQLYFAAWLDLRVPWMYVLGRYDATVTRTLSSQLWRDYLKNARGVLSSASSDTRASERRSHLASILAKVLPSETLNAPAGSARWMEHTFDGAVPSRLWPRILWELHEVAFRYELLELNRTLVLNSAHSGADAEMEEVAREALICAVFGACSLQVSEGNSALDGLASDIRNQRGRALDSWLEVVRRWSTCPDTLRNCAKLEFQFSEGQMNFVERVLVQYYIVTFFEWAGHLPILPRRYPGYL